MRKKEIVLPEIPKGERAELTGALLRWYDGNRRILPWREDPTPYRVWVSEIMLQQTRVTAVLPYFERFMAVLPDVRVLAEAEEGALAKLWEGLGYYSRMRNLQKAARIVMDEYGGEIPGDYEKLRALPGIGEYSAGAIGSIAFGLRVPAVDGNVLRVLARLRACELDILDSAVKKAFTQMVMTLQDEKRPGDFNQAMMELGATVCLPGGAPDCTACPFRDHCKAHAQGIEETLPRKAPKKERRLEDWTVFVIRSSGRYLLRRRPERGLLAGLWEFPAEAGILTAERGKDVLSRWGLKVCSMEAAPSAKHIFTHVEWRMTGYLAEVEETAAPSDWVWATAEEIERRYALPGAYQAFAGLLKAPLQQSMRL